MDTVLRIVGSVMFSLLTLSLPTRAASLSGPAQITDGDTIKILEIPIRLEGIDAPETGQNCKRPGGGRDDLVPRKDVTSV